MTQKEFYSLIDKFIQAGYDENAKITLKWTTKSRCGIVERGGDTIYIKWNRYKWYSGEQSGYTTEIVFDDRGTWYMDDPRCFHVSGTIFKPFPPCSVEGEPYDYKTAEEVFGEDFDYYYGRAYRNWKVEE